MLLRMGNRSEVPTSGTVRFHGDDITGLDPMALWRGVGMVSQRPISVAGILPDNFPVAGPASDSESADGLTNGGPQAPWPDRPADQLSGAEAERAGLARTVSTRPEVLLIENLDGEPTSS